MADKISPEKRSQNMKAIRSKDTSPELFIRKLLFNEGYRYRLHSKLIPGKPDLFLKKYNTAIFIHGCYWHRHKGCKNATLPKSNIEFWENKFTSNTNRDLVVKNQLKEKGIKQLVIWECTIRKADRNKADKTDLLEKIVKFLNSENMQYFEI